MMKLRRPKIDLVENLRPQSLEEYIGQEQIKDLLWTSIQAAKKRGQPLDHVLLNGPPGLGKTTLANIIAHEMGWGIKTIIAPSLGSPRIATQLLLGLGPMTILFIDEVHRVKQPVQEVFYPALEDGKIFSALTREETEIQLNPITFIGATTNIGKLTQPFIDRFGLQFQLEYYTHEELSAIVLASMAKLKMPPDWEVAETIAKRARGTPRIANQYLKRIRDYWDLDPTQKLDSEFAARIIEKKLHTDELGLRIIDHKYLRFLSYQDRPVGVDVIATQMGEDVDTVQDFIEPYLLKLGFMERRQTGRWLTEQGKTFLNTVKSPR